MTFEPAKMLPFCHDAQETSDLPIPLDFRSESHSRMPKYVGLHLNLYGKNPTWLLPTIIASNFKLNPKYPSFGFSAIAVPRGSQ